MIDIAMLTVRELIRRRFVIAAIAVTLLLAALTAWGFSHMVEAHNRTGRSLSRIEILAVSAIMLILIAYMFSFVLAVVGVFIAAPSVANDIESGVLLPVLTRPISRAALLSGKILALAAVVCAYAAFAGLLEFAVVRAITGYLPPHPAQSVAYLCLLAVCMLVLTAALSTRLSAIASSIVAIVFFGLAWIAGIAGSLGAFYGNDAIRNAGIISQLLLPTDAMWREAVYRLEPAATLALAGSGHGWPGPFFVLSPPPLATLMWTIAWIIVVYAMAVRSFALRDL
ncbi:MAG TPA: ABC transporter permease subunit [Candidatus Baltobacteraceae bacterium]|jgi:ABC-type transport system involved in multi-copper enzyme maturation permease subunit|nr:ABC transporter permease subunit [Candidatus Baltobacteraceae bacterium]